MQAMPRATITATNRSSTSEGTLDAEGKLAIDFPTTVSDHKTDYRYRVEARVTDAGKREIMGRGSVIATYGSFVVNARPDRYFYQPGEQRGDHGGSARLRFQAGAHARPRRTVPLELAAARRNAESELLRAADVDTGADGTGIAQIAIPPQGGSTACG